MGNIKTKLAQTEIDEARMFSKGFSVELCENVHFHYKDLRLEFSYREFQIIADAFENAKEEFKACVKEKGYQEDLESWYYRKNLNRNHPLKTVYREIPEQGSFEGRCIIELQDDRGEAHAIGGEDTIHVHFHNLRLHLKRGDFFSVATAFQDALENLKGGWL